MIDTHFNKLTADRMEYLENLIAEKEKALRHTIPGRLRIVCRGRKNYYYQRTDPRDTNGKYIDKKHFSLAQALAQQDYDRQILQLAKIELKGLQGYLPQTVRHTVETYYQSLAPTRQALVQPVCLTDQEYARQWLQMPWQQGVFMEDGKKFLTKGGEQVRSKSELIIANALFDRNIPYRYECMCILPSQEIFCPDFTALNSRRRQEYLWEHLGMMDSPEYAQRALYKINKYEENGFFPGVNLILTHETSDAPLNPQLLDKIIDTYLH